MNRDEDDDLQALRRQLPVPAERDFPAGRRHQREEHLMTSWLTMSRRTDKRRNLGVRVALPVGLAAAAAGIALTALPAQTAAAYTLQTADDGVVKLTIVDPSGKIDLDGLQKGLDRLGVHSRVYAGDPGCAAEPSATASPEPGPSDAPPSASASPEPGPIDASPSASANPELGPNQAAPTAPAGPEPADGNEAWDISSQDGKPVLSVNPGKLPAGKQLQIVFPLAKTDPAHALAIISAGLGDGPGPDCAPALPAGSVSFNG